MKTTHRFFLAILTIFFMLSQGCLPEKEDPKNDENDYQSALDNSLLESEFSNMASQFDAEAQNSDDVKKNSAGIYCPCSQVSIEIVGVKTYKLTVDYGTGCICNDGRKREGILTGIFHGKWSEPGTYVEITPTNYKVTTLLGEKFDVDFTNRLTYNGPDQAGHISLTAKVGNATFTSDRGTIKWDAERTTEWIEGLGDLDPSNNVYLVTGRATGTTIEGQEFEVTIDQALRAEVSCAHITEGSFSITPKGKDALSLDYGDGTCDNKAIFSVGNFTTEIVLR